MSHSPRDIDLKSLGIHRLVAEKILASPALFERARDNLEKLCDRGDMAVLPYLTEWQAIFDRSMAVAMSIAVEDSERGQFLRTCSPFSGIFSESERLEWLEKWADRRRG